MSVHRLVIWFLVVQQDKLPFTSCSKIFQTTKKDFDGNVWDILVGGGSGEAPALRISHPTAFQFFTYDEDLFAKIDFSNIHEIYKPFWTPTQSYLLGEGFIKLGWTPDRPLEMWLAENVCRLLIAAIDKFAIYRTLNADLIAGLKFNMESY